MSLFSSCGPKPPLARLFDTIFILIQVFKHLGWHDLGQVALVCKTWKKVDQLIFLIHQVKEMKPSPFTIANDYQMPGRRGPTAVEGL